MREKDASQDIDQVTFNRPITKWAYSIPTAGKVQEAVRSAFRVALTEPLGPVHLDVSKDILLAEADAGADRAGSLPAHRGAGLRERRSRPRRRTDRASRAPASSWWAAACCAKTCSRR